MILQRIAKQEISHFLFVSYCKIHQMVFQNNRRKTSNFELFFQAIHIIVIKILINLVKLK